MHKYHFVILYILVVSIFLAAFFSSIPVCHTASSPILFPPPVTSLVSSMASELHPSLSSMPLEVQSSTDSDVLKLLPPFLSDQGQLVQVHATFHLFCHGTGPKDSHFLWEKDGVKMESCAKDAILPLAGGNVHILGWVRDIATKDAEYRCTIETVAGRKSSRVFVRVTGSLNPGWSNELSRWKSAISEHSNIMEGWKKNWESCNKKDVN